MPNRHILVVAIDGLRASALGAYGNTAYSTPSLDEFSAESCLFDWCFASTAELATNYRALWQSVHALRADNSIDAAPSLSRLLDEMGYQSTLITDDAELAAQQSIGDFGRFVQVASGTCERSPDISHTAMANIFSEVCEAIAAPHSGPQLVWVHSRGMYGTWDAPLDLQQRLLVDDGLTTVSDVNSPDLLLAEADDPDELYRYGSAYAAQVMVLDACWGAINVAVSSGDEASWLVILTGVRGFPLGEHRQIGGVDRRLYVEQLHVPWLMRFPDGRGKLARCGKLVSQLDLLPTLLDWVLEGEQKPPFQFDGMSALPLVVKNISLWRDAMVFGDSIGSWGIRTPSWSMRQDSTCETGVGELFVRPDDRWEANNVAGLCPDVVEGLKSTAKEFRGGQLLSDSNTPEESSDTPN